LYWQRTILVFRRMKYLTMWLSLERMNKYPRAVRFLSSRAHWTLCLALLLLLAPLEMLAQGPGVARRPKPPKTKPPVEQVEELESTGTADPGVRLPLLDVRVEGAKRFPPEKIAALAGLKVGQPANRDAFQRAHKRLVETGLYEVVAYRFEKPEDKEGYILTFEVVESELYYPIKLEEIPIPLEEVEAYLRDRDPGFDGNAVATEPGMARYAGLVQDLLKENGVDMPVRGQVWAEQGGDLYVLFRPDRPIPSISDVRFEGSEKIEPLELRRQIIQTATGNLFTEERFRTVLKNEILPYYWAIGHLNVQFPKIEAVPLEEEKGVRVTVQVDEGPEFTMREARILTREFREQDLLDIAKFPVGETASWKQVAVGVKAMEARIKRDGFLNVRFTIEPDLHAEDAQVDLTVSIDEGPQFLFRQLKIQGLDLVTEQELRKLWAMDPGKPFNGLYPDFFLQQIRDRELMDGLGEAQSKVELNERSHDATVTLIFKPVDRSKPPRVPLVRPN
jgi:outer membrane protein assembly factor BamA